MCDASTACSGRQVKLWDKDFNLLHTFGPGESFVKILLDAPAAKAISAQSREGNFRMYLTKDQDGMRWTAGLSSFSVVHTGDHHMLLNWASDVVPVRDYGSPFYQATN